MCSFCNPSTGACAIRAAHLVHEHASSLGFDWPEIGGVFDKVEEELDEVRDAHREGDVAHARRELGDLLFSVINLARFLDADPIAELDGARGRFTDRFDRLQCEVERRGWIMNEHSLEELDEIWEEVKRTDTRA